MKEKEELIQPEETDEYVKVCPFCGGREIIIAYQSSYAAVTALSHKLGLGRELYHSVCRGCGTVLRSFVKEPEKLLKKKDRRI